MKSFLKRARFHAAAINSPKEFQGGNSIEEPSIFHVGLDETGLIKKSPNNSTFKIESTTTMKYLPCFIISFVIIGCTSQKTEPRVWKSIEQSLQTQLITINDGDTLHLPEGNFMFTKSLAMDGKSNIVIRGKGMDKTVLCAKTKPKALKDC